MYYGVFTTNNLATLSSIATFEKAARKKVSIIMWYQDWGLTDGTQDFQPAWMDNVYSHGAIPMITWEPYDPYAQGGANQPKFSLSKIIAGDFDVYITKWALASKQWGKAYFLRLAHEMNGNWYPWSEGVNGNMPSEYIQAWKHIHDIFTKNGVINITWVWCPNTVFKTSLPLAGLYPGDDYVDWVGMDNYNWGNLQTWSTWESFTSLFKPTYDQLRVITSKPQMVGEMACAEQGGSKAQWITSLLTKELTLLPEISAIIWFNVKKEADWRIQSSLAAQTAFSKAITASEYKTNIYAVTMPTPIPKG